MRQYILFAILFFFGTHNINAQIITTIAGTGWDNYTGDGGPATLATLYSPLGVAVDQSDNIYVADTKNHCIRKVDVAGTITTITGNGIAGYSGDGGPASEAQINLPSKITTDASGNVYFIDNGNRRIRKIKLDGTISTIAGNGMPDNTGDGGPATDAAMNASAGLAIDQFGNIYFGDLIKNTIRKINTSGIISTIAGTGVSGYTPDGIPATDAMLNQPFGIDVDDFGNIYVAEYMNNCIRKIDATGIVSTLTGHLGTGYSGDGGPATLAHLNSPFDVTVASDGSIVIADYGNSAIRKIAPNGLISTIGGNGVLGSSGDGGPATNANIKSNTDVALDIHGNLLLTEASGSSKIRKVSGLVSVESVMNTVKKIRVYPNPSNVCIHVYVESKVDENITICMYNILGEKVYQQNDKTNKEILIKTEAFANGEYILSVRNSTTNTSERLIIND